MSRSLPEAPEEHHAGVQRLVDVVDRRAVLDRPRRDPPDEPGRGVAQLDDASLDEPVLEARDDHQVDDPERARDDREEDERELDPERRAEAGRLEPHRPSRKR